MISNNNGLSQDLFNKSIEYVSKVCYTVPKEYPNPATKLSNEVPDSVDVAALIELNNIREINAKGCIICCSA